MLEPLLEHLSRYITLTPVEVQLLMSRVQYQQLPKKEFLLKEARFARPIISSCRAVYDYSW